MTAKLSALPVVIFLMLLQPDLALAQQTATYESPWNWPGPWHMWGGWGMWWIFPLIMLLMIAGCIAMIMHRSGRTGRHHADSPSADPMRSALQILNERFARGEIRREEYEERKRAILTVTAPTGNV